MINEVYGSSARDLLPGLSTNDKLLTLVSDRKKSSSDSFARFHNEMDGWHNSYMAFNAGARNPWRNDIAMPLVFSMVEKDVAQKVMGIFGANPLIDFYGWGPEDEPIAQKNALLISAQLEECKSFQKSIDFCKSANLYGASVARMGWTHIERLRRWREPDGMGGLIELKQPVVQFSGPDWENRDLRDYFPEPGKVRHEKLGWEIDRYYVDYDDLVDMQSATNVFLPGALEALRERPMSAQDTDRMLRRTTTYRNFEELNGRSSSRFEKPVEIWEMWGKVPAEFAMGDDRNRVVVIANGKVVLRNDPNPWWNGLSPFRIYNICPNPHTLYGPGKVYIAQKLQNAAARLTNQRLDILDLFVSPQFIGDSRAFKSTENFYTKPGRMHVADLGNKSINEVIMPLTPNLSGLGASHEEVASLFRLMQMGTGHAEDVSLGFGAQGNPATAREIMVRSEQVQTRLGMEAMHLSKEFLEPLAEWIRDANKQVLPLPKQVNYMGVMAVMDPNTGLPLPQEPSVIYQGEVNHDWRARAVGPMQMMTKAVQAQNAIQVWNLYQNNPALLTITNWVAFGKRVARLFDMDPTDLLLTEVPMINDMAGELGMQGQELTGPGQQAVSPLEGVSDAPYPIQQEDPSGRA